MFKADCAVTTLLGTFLVVVIKCLTKATEALVLLTVMVGKSLQQDHEAAGYIVSPVKTDRGKRWRSAHSW